MGENYYSQEKFKLEPKEKTIKFLLDYSKSIKVLYLKNKSLIINLN